MCFKRFMCRRLTCSVNLCLVLEGSLFNIFVFGICKCMEGRSLLKLMQASVRGVGGSCLLSRTGAPSKIAVSAMPPHSQLGWLDRLEPKFA